VPAPDPTAWERLRAPFKDSEISKRPQPTVRAEEYRQLEKSSCGICGGYHPVEKTIHLDYIGHARVTQRLNEADPEWTWTWGADDPETGKPSKHLSLTTDPDGSVSLWMAMTALGVTRRDVGYAPAKAEQLKDAVSDAISRCGMRFGIGLGLWIKEQGDARPVQSETGSASSWPTRHEQDGRGGVGPKCPTADCQGHLIQRATKTGKSPGSPFLVCSSGKENGCGMNPIWDTRLEDYVKGEAEFANVAGDPAEDLGAPMFPEANVAERGPTALETVLADVSLRPPSAIPALTGVPANCAEIRRLIGGMTDTTIRDVFTSVGGGAQLISPRTGGGWKLSAGKLADAGEAVQIELIAALAKANG
jgi:hypothetical protein